MEIAVGKLLKKNKVKLDNIIDEKLIGGFAIQIEGHIIDASMNKRMQNLTLSVKNGSAD